MDIISKYFISELRLDLYNILKNKLDDTSINKIMLEMSDGDIMSLYTTGKIIPNHIGNKQLYTENLLNNYSEYIQENLNFIIEANNNSYKQYLIERDTYFTPKPRDTYFTPKPRDTYFTPKSRDTYFTPATKNQPSTPIQNHNQVEKITPKIEPHNANKPTPHIHNHKTVPLEQNPKTSTNTLFSRETSNGDSNTFQTAMHNFKDFFMRNHGQNLKIGLGVATASALAYAAYKMWKNKTGDVNKAKQAQISQLNRAKAMASKTTNPNAFKKKIDEKITKIQRGK